MSHAKMYVCDTWDDLCDIGEHTIDHRCYRSRKDAELRASRLTYDDEGVRNYARVVELDACWEPDDAERWYAKYVAQWIAWRNLLDENAKLRELCADMFEDCVDECDRWRYGDRMRELGIEVS